MRKYLRAFPAGLRKDINSHTMDCLWVSPLWEDSEMPGDLVPQLKGAVSANNLDEFRREP